MKDKQTKTGLAVYLLSTYIIGVCFWTILGHSCLLDFVYFHTEDHHTVVEEVVTYFTVVKDGYQYRIKKKK